MNLLDLSCGRACPGPDTHSKVSWMNIHVCISYASLQQRADKHLARMLMKQTDTPSPAAVFDSAWLPRLTLTINPAQSTLPSVLSFHLSSHFHIPSLLLDIIFAAPLLLPHRVLRPEDIGPHGRLWYFHPSSCPPHTPPPTPELPHCVSIIPLTAQPGALST